MAILVWTSILDPKRTCPTCFDLNGREEPEEFWEATGTPGIRDTECNGNCLCMLIDASWTTGKLQNEITKAVDESFEELAGELLKGIKIDTTRGGFIRDPIILKDYADIKGFTTLPIEKIRDHQKALVKWKRANNFKTLPDEFYQINDVLLQIKWLLKK